MITPDHYDHFSVEDIGKVAGGKRIYIAGGDKDSPGMSPSLQEKDRRKKDKRKRQKKDRT